MLSRPTSRPAYATQHSAAVLSGFVLPVTLFRRCSQLVRHAQKPSNSAEVAEYASSEFKREVAWTKPEHHVHLAKACLLIALEEEAARELNKDSPSNESLASSSTWSLERLDALAAEISAYFKHSVVPGLLAASGRRDSILQSLEGSSSQPASRRSNAPGASTPSLSSAAHLNFASDELPPTIDDAVWAEVSKALPRDHIPHGASAFASSSPSSSAAQAVPGQQQDLEQQQDEQQDEQQQGASPAGASTHIDQLVASLSEQQVQKLMQQYPVQALSAVNSVMFDRHGYKAGNRYGVSFFSQLSAVMEYGFGNSAALSILYMEVCARLGLAMHARPVEQGRYFLVWPAEVPLTVGGQQFVVDPYGGGGLMAADEACELFGYEPQELMRPAGRRHLLACLLADLLDCHWARAARCSAKPALMTPLDVETVLSGRVPVQGGGYSIARALAAAEKRLLLLPGDRDARLQCALLLYMNQRYDDAWLELGILLEQQRQGQEDDSGDEEEARGPRSTARIAILQEKIRLLLSVASGM